MLSTSSMEQLETSLRGHLIRPQAPDYDEARAVWNGIIDRRPALIVRCLGAADVMRAVEFARDMGLPVSVRGGGHSVAGTSVREGGLMIDLSLMRGVRVDPDARTARVDPGARLGDMDRETQAFGLATTGGVDSRTGVAGLTLGGGVGFLARKCGLAIDNLQSADVLTTDGKLVRASESSNADLFWALRGGGGNFGIVTSFEFRLHAIGPQVLTAQIFHPLEAAASVLRLYRDFMANAPDELSCYALFVNVPPIAAFPEEQHGRTAVVLVACHTGDGGAGAQALAPLTEFGEPMLRVVEPMPYVQLQRAFDAGAPDGQRYYWKSHYLRELSDDAIDTVLGFVDRLPGPFSNVFFEPMGGAIGRVGVDETAFPHRQAPFSIGLSSGWSDPAKDADGIAWTRTFHDAMAAYSTGGVYVNYLDHDEGDRLSAAYGPNYERLRAIKAKYDPQNLLRGNQSLTP